MVFQAFLTTEPPPSRARFSSYGKISALKEKNQKISGGLCCVQHLVDLFFLGGGDGSRGSGWGQQS